MAEINFEPVEDTVKTNFLFQYYTNESGYKNAIQTDYRHAVITPGQSSFKIMVKDGYDQFAFLGFLEYLFEGAPHFYIPYDYDVAFAGYRIYTINDYVLYAGDFYPSLEVDHRSGFWQHVFYRSDTSFAYFRILLILGALCAAIYIIILLVKRRK